MRWIYQNDNALFILDGKPVKGTKRIGRVIPIQNHENSYDLLLGNKQHEKIMKMIKKLGKKDIDIKERDFEIIKGKKIYYKIYYRIRRKI